MAVFAVRGGSVDLPSLALKTLVSLIGMGVFFGLLGFFLGLITRSLAAGVILGFVIVLVLPLAFFILAMQVPWLGEWLNFLPMMASQNMVTFTPADGPFWPSQLGGLTVCLIWLRPIPYTYECAQPRNFPTPAQPGYRD